MASPVVEAAPDAPAAAPQVQPQNPPPADGGAAQNAPDSTQGVPPELMKIPAVQGLLAGTPAAVSANLKAFKGRDEEAAIVKNKDWMLDAGFGFYKSLSGHLGVVYNSMHIHPADLQAADKAGKLGVVAPDFDKVNHELGKAGVSHPIFQARGRQPQAPAKPHPNVMAPPQMGSGLGAALTPSPAAGKPTGPLASIQRQTAGARLKNLQPGAPTSGPSPGSGRLLNSLLKTPV